MSEQRRFGRRRRGMHFKPSGHGPKPTKHQEREAQQARAEAVNENVPITGERLFEPQRYAREIERSENVAAGLPPEGAPADPAGDDHTQEKRDFRQPHLDTPAHVEEEFAPVEIQEKPRNLLEAIKNVATKAIQHVRKLIRPVKKNHKDV